MKFICEKSILLDAVSKVGRAVPAKSTYPSLEGILLKTGNDTLSLSGYDMEMGITTRIDAEIEEPGSIVLSSRLFSDIVRRLPNDEVEIAVDEKLNVYIKSGKSEFHILGISDAEYPDLPVVDDGIGFTLPQNTLASMIRQTIFSVSQNDSRPVHKGILFEMENNVLRLVAVDGSRLALRSETIQNVEEMRFIIPGKTLLEVLKLLNDEDTPVTLAVGRRHVIMEINGYAVISRLLEGEFLPYKKAIPEGFGTVIRVKTRDLIDAVDRASLVISDNMKSPLVCCFEENEVKLFCTTSMGSVSDSLPANVDGESTEIGFNSRYIMDALRNTECDEIRLEVKGPLSPMKILPVEGDSFLFMILPVRLKK